MQFQSDYNISTLTQVLIALGVRLNLTPATAYCDASQTKAVSFTPPVTFWFAATFSGISPQ